MDRDIIILQKLGKYDYRVLINGWVFLDERFLLYDSEEDIIDTIRQRVANHMGMKPEEVVFE